MVYNMLNHKQSLYMQLFAVLQLTAMQWCIDRDPRVANSNSKLWLALKQLPMLQKLAANC